MQGKPLLTIEEYMEANKYDKPCAAKARETRTIDFPIPAVESKFGVME